MIVTLFMNQLFASELSLEEAIRLAHERSWDVKTEDMNLEINELQRRAVIGGLLPQIDGSATYYNYITPPDIGGFRLNSTHQMDFGVNVRQRLFEFGGLGSSLKAASALLKQGAYQKEQVKNYITLETTTAYYSILLSREQVKIAEESLQNARNNLRILRESFAAGRAPRGDILRLETDIVSRESQLNIARSDYRSSLIALKELIKVERDQNLSLTTNFKTELPIITEQGLKDTLAAQNLELRVLGQELQYLDSLSAVQRSNFLPKLGAFYSLSTSGRSERGPFGNDESVNTQVVGVELRWNLWDGGTSRTRYEESKRNVIVAQHAVRRAEDKLLRDLDTALNEYESIRENLSIDQQSLTLAQQSFELTQGLLRTGKTSITELNSVEGVLNGIKVNYAVNLFRAHERLSFINFLLNSRDLQ